MAIRLDDARRGAILRGLAGIFADEFDEELSDFRAARILAYFVEELGPPIYNQAVQDVRAHLARRLEELDAEFHEPESRPGEAPT